MGDKFVFFFFNFRADVLQFDQNLLKSSDSKLIDIFIDPKYVTPSSLKLFLGPIPQCPILRFALVGRNVFWLTVRKFSLLFFIHETDSS